MKAFARFLFVFSLTAFCAACGGGGGGSASSPPPPPVVNASPGGIWEGIDSDGDSVLALVTETGRFHFIDELGNQGSGILSVSNGNDVTGNFQLVPEPGFTFPDGTTLADCALSGTVTERQTLTVTVNCTTTAGLQDQTTATLNYNVLYERDSSLPTIAGTYDDGSGVLTDIAADGAIFEQDPVSGCVTNGQVSVINSAFNAYDVQFGFSNCTGQFAIFNGTNFVGIATLDNTVTPEVLFVGATGDVGGILVSVVLVAERRPVPPPPPPPPPMSAAGNWDGNAVTPDIADVVTSFEFNDADGFIIGSAPFTANFTGGVAESRGIGALYTDGTFSWHVGPAGASIDFATPGNSLAFFTRTVTAGDNATIQVFDDQGVEIMSTAVPDAFQQIVVNRDPGAGESLIAQVVITVNAGEIVIDSFSFGYPSTASDDGIGCLFAPAPSDRFICAVNDGISGDVISTASGTFQVNGDQVTGSGFLYAVPGETLLNGDTVAPLTVSAGTVSEDTSLNLTIDMLGLSIAVTMTPDIDNTFDRGAALATVEAMYTTFNIFGDASSFNVDANGMISGQTATGCVFSGQIDVIDPAANAYDVSFVADAATCLGLGGDYVGLGTTGDANATDDVFLFLVVVEGQRMIVAAAIK